MARFFENELLFYGMTFLPVACALIALSVSAFLVAAWMACAALALFFEHQIGGVLLWAAIWPAIWLIVRNEDRHRELIYTLRQIQRSEPKGGALAGAPKRRWWQRS